MATFETEQARTLVEHLAREGRVSHRDREILVEAISARSWEREWQRTIDLRTALGDRHPECAPAVYRGIGGIMAPGGESVFGLSLMTFDARYHQFALTDLELKRLVRDVVARWPHQDFGQGFTGRHADDDVGSRATVDASQPGTDASTRPANNASRAS